MKKMIVAATVLACGLFVATSMNYAGGAKKATPKCPVSGKPCVKEHSVDHNGGKVYFCCPNCPPVFKDKTEKFASKANFQLYVTGQAKLVKCPFQGKKLNPETKIDVSGMPVCFCCENCQAKAKKLEGQKQVDAIFNDKNFKKGFEVKKAK